ncbi:hypothetical protein B0H13DRAFT_1860233 [Mycena leptocephala]|nr:hypothetical protein B0H13DRAFT_1860233 [Mycena leptocephala]
MAEMGTTKSKITLNLMLDVQISVRAFPEPEPELRVQFGSDLADSTSNGDSDNEGEDEADGSEDDKIVHPAANYTLKPVLALTGVKQGVKQFDPLSLYLAGLVFGWSWLYNRRFAMRSTQHMPRALHFPITVDSPASRKTDPGPEYVSHIH